MKAISTPTGSIRIATSALRTYISRTPARRLWDLRSALSECRDGARSSSERSYRLHRHALRQAGRSGETLALKRLPITSSVLAVAGSGDAGDHLAVTVQLGDPGVCRHQFDPRHAAHQHAGAALGSSAPAPMRRPAAHSPLPHHVFSAGLAISTTRPPTSRLESRDHGDLHRAGCRRRAASSIDGDLVVQ